MLGLARFDGDVVFLAVLPHDPSLINFHTRTQEKTAPTPQLVPPVSRRHARLESHQNPPVTTRNFPFELPIARENVVKDALPLGVGEEFRAKTHETAGRNVKLDAGGHFG